MSKEIQVSHDEIGDAVTIRTVLEGKFAAHDLDLHRHEVEHMEDDFKAKKRIMKVKNTKYFFQGS